MPRSGAVVVPAFAPVRSSSRIGAFVVLPQPKEKAPVRYRRTEAEIPTGSTGTEPFRAMPNVANEKQSSNRAGRSPPNREEVLDAIQVVLDALDLHEKPRCLSMEDAAERLGVSKRTLDTLVHKGEVQSLKIGRRRVVPLRALEAYVERKLDGGPPG